MKKTIRTEVVAVGTEILLGQIVNTNAQWISEQLAMNGVNTYHQTVVGDNLERMVQAFQIAADRSDVIIITGGLGPTEDDVSREAFQQLSHLQIVEDKSSMEKIEKFYRNQHSTMTPNNRRQARIFANSIILENKTGMAPGNIVKHGDKTWIFLPGVPKEMKQIFSDDVIPYLKNMNGEMVIESSVLRFSGIGESLLEHRLHHLISAQDNPTIAPLAQRDGVTIRLTAKAKTKAETQSKLNHVKELILAEVGEFFYGENHDTIEGKVKELLQENSKTIASAESLTGGLFADKFISLPGASDVFKGAVVCYDEQVKQNVLQVEADTIKKHGTVSSQCALELAKNIASIIGTTIGISFTGVAGPDTVEGKDVGTVFIGVYDQETGYEHAESCYFQGDRRDIRYRSILKGYNLILQYLRKE